MEFERVPTELLREADEVPEFWVSTAAEVQRFLSQHVHRGTVSVIGTSAGGRPIHAVAYGTSRGDRGTTTFSGALGMRGRVRHYLGPDAHRRVMLHLAGVHGGEFEGIVGTINLLSVLETGADLRGRPWPGLLEVAQQVDRVLVVPILNVDGRARIPLRMAAHRGTDDVAHRYWNTGTWANGDDIGWPTCKQFIPLEFRQTQFPGGYPNDGGVNLQHDDFLGQRQPETDALLRLVGAERPDLVVNMHTGVPLNNYFVRMHRPFAEPALQPVFDRFYRRVQTRLAQEGQQSTRDPDLEADPSAVAQSPFNLDAALNLHCGALSVIVEAPSHSFDGWNRAGEQMHHTPDMILDGQLLVHEEALHFLAEEGGRMRWAPGRPEE